MPSPCPIPDGTQPRSERDLVDWLTLSRARRVGPTTFIRLIRQHRTARAALAALPEIAAEAGEKTYRLPDRRFAETDLANAARAGARPICLGAEDYPPALYDLSDPPPVLWAMGEVGLAARSGVALVGARNASALGRRMATRLARDLGERGYVVVSGLARGIDEAAHQAALPTGTIAVQAGGIDTVYPRETEALHAAIVEAGGLRLSEMPPGVQPQARHFPRRNRIVAALAEAIVVVEGAARSGSLITARMALDLGRDVMAVPGHPMDSRASGCNMLIRDGALLVRSGEDVAEALAAPVAPIAPATPTPAAEPPAPTAQAKAPRSHASPRSHRRAPLACAPFGGRPHPRYRPGTLAGCRRLVRTLALGTYRPPAGRARFPHCLKSEQTRRLTSRELPPHGPGPLQQGRVAFSPMAVVVVESPAKAKTINAYLGKDYKVLASYGHVRDLPPKDGSVDPDNKFEMLWEVAASSKKHVAAIADALKGDDTLILATDPDREGEAISWHLEEALRKRRAIKKDTHVERVVFNAITKSAVTEAMKNPRQIDTDLVEAYLARRALDYLVGFNLSPVLWRKLPGSRSAGRVQSVTLRLIVEREMEIEAFKAREYWSVKAILTTPRGQDFEARLTVLGGKKLDKFDIDNQAAAELAVQAITSRDLSVLKVEAKPATRNPSPPFMTSTLQQEASRKFGFGARQTMSTAQRLYEAGYITYMRTDGIDMAPEAVHAARDAIKARYGGNYVPGSPRMYKNKAKNAQEAHECIRPTDMTKSAADLPLTEADQKKLYDLIWKRTLASQMEAAKFERTTVDVGSADGEVVLRATGQVVTFDGFLKVYEEGRDDVIDDEEDGARLPQIMEGEATAKKTITPEQHFTQPPPRYTEATLVKKMEELGIGRPSTYASIVSVIQEREYVRKEKNRLIPEDKGRLVTAFLSNYFRRYVGYDFTASLEEELDEITSGDRDWQDVLERFWKDFSAAVAETAELRITDVLEKINEVLEPHLFPPNEDGTDPRLCKTCGTGRLSMRTARSGGAFIGCSNYPECRYTRPISGELEGGDVAGPDGKLLGHDEGLPVTLRTGRFGPFVQLGEQDPEDKDTKPKRASIPKGMDLSAVDLEKALELLSLPRVIGEHPDGGRVETAIGRYGPYVMHERPLEEGQKKAVRIYANLEDASEVFTLGMNRAVELIAQKAQKTGRGAAQPPLKELGEHPDGGPVAVMSGRYGPYVKWEKINATIPKEIPPEDVTMDIALELIEAKQAAKGKGKKKAAPKKKAAAKKPAAKKTAAKKSAGTKAETEGEEA